MRVKRDFDAIYRTQADPWQIGAADSERYNLYFDLIEAAATARGTLVDIGCGFGAFLARFSGRFQRLIGVELAAEAIAKGRQRFPAIEFVQGSAGALAQALPGEARYDAVVFSDVIYYLDEAEKHAALRWIAGHLSPDGLGFIAAWCPGGRYLEYDELQRLVRRYFAVESERLLASGHAVFVARPKRHLIAITIDYETWQPIPPGKRIDWEADVFTPTERLLTACEQAQAPVTLMAEMGEYLWLCEHEPAIARRMEAQWQEALRRGHDVQLHLHPSWLPELGARREGEQWYWDWTKAKADDYPGDLTRRIGECKAALEQTLRAVKPDYRVTAFRAGAYQAQPFRRLYAALAAHGIGCDSSVYAGGLSAERGYDYTLAYSDHQPYFASACDPQLKAPPAEQAVLELPIFTPRPNDRWFLDNDRGSTFAGALLRYLQRQARRFAGTSAYRRRKQLRRYLGAAYARLRPVHRWLNSLLPRALAHFIADYPSEALAGHEYFVLIGHSKSDLRFADIAANLRRLRQDGCFEFVTLSAMAAAARRELQRSVRPTPGAEAEYQVRREYRAVLGDQRNAAQFYRLQAMIPADRGHVLDLGCGAGYWSERIARLYPWMRVTGIDAGADFIARANAQYASPRVAFQVADFAALPFADGSFDCVYADNTLEHSFDVDATLGEAYRVLAWGGVLVAALPSDARNPRRSCDNHTWKTAPHEVRLRLERAGFVDVAIEEVDSFRRLGMPPYPPSNDRMMYVRAWKRRAPASQLERALAAMDWVYHRLDPQQRHASGYPVDILVGGYAWCFGYATALQFILEREGYRTRRMGFRMQPHPRGHGPEQVDSHSVLEVWIDGRWQLFDPMCNVWFRGHSLADLVRNPALASAALADHVPDVRFTERQYQLYCSEWAYAHCRDYYYEERKWLSYLKRSEMIRRWWVQFQMQRRQG